MKYLVTGGCGFIGSHLVELLLQRGHDVMVLDNLSTGNRANLPRNVPVIVGDVADPVVAALAMHGMDGVYHLAAIASVEKCTEDWVGSHRTNLTGTIVIFDQAGKAGRIPVVFASSAAVYGDNPDLPLREDSYARPVSAYGADKLACEQHGLVATHIHGVPNCGLRFFNVYGPRQDPKSPYSGVITIFGDRMKRQQPITINGDGYHSRDFIYVRDVVLALMGAMDYCRDNREHHVFNVCTGVETNIIDLVEELALLFGPTQVRHGPPRPGDPRASIGDPSKAMRELSFGSSISLASGLAETFGGSVRNTERPLTFA